MATSEERRKILEMVVSGKISAEEAAAMLNDEPAAVAPVATEAAPVPEEEVAAKSETQKVTDTPVDGEQKGPKWLHIRVSDLKSGRRKVSVNIPLRLVDIGVKIGGGFAPELKEIDWAEISTMLAEGEQGTLVEVEDEEDGEHVHIYVA
jgi:hypothetical protein